MTVDYICEKICENVHSSHIQFFNFDAHKIYCKRHIHVKYSGTVELANYYSPLLSLKFQIYIATIPCGFYRSLDEQNWMCQLYTSYQILSHIMVLGRRLTDSYAVVFKVGSYIATIAISDQMRKMMVPCVARGKKTVSRQIWVN